MGKVAEPPRPVTATFGDLKPTFAETASRCRRFAGINRSRQGPGFGRAGWHIPARAVGCQGRPAPRPPARTGTAMTPRRRRPRLEPLEARDTPGFLTLTYAAATRTMTVAGDSADH